MTLWYADSINGNDGNGGTSWVDAKLTLNGVEDIPIVDGDTAYCRGEFPETLTCDISAAGEIVYEGVVHPETGNMARITGSDNDQTATRNYGINLNGKAHRTFRGFRIDSCIQRGASLWGDDCTFEDCIFLHNGLYGVYMTSASVNLTIRRCMCLWNGEAGIYLSTAGNEDDTAILLENSIFAMNVVNNVYNNGKGGTVINACLMTGAQRGARLFTLNAGQTMIVKNSLVFNNYEGFYAEAAGFLVEDYNGVHNNFTARTNVNVGANSQVYIPQMATPILEDGYYYSWLWGMLSEWSAYRAIAGSSPPADDLHGISRVTPSSWGPIQYEATRRGWDCGAPRGRRGA
jgi:hypothetical protein